MSSVFFKVFLVCHFFQFHHLKSALSCAQYPHSLPFHLILLKNIILSALQNLPAAALDKLVAFPKTKCSLSSIKGVLIDESNRNCQTDRRPRPCCHPQGDPPHHAYPGRRPVTDDIGTVGKILLRHAGSVKKVGTGLYIVTEDRWPTVGIREEWNWRHKQRKPVVFQRICAVCSVSIMSRKAKTTFHKTPLLDG